MLSKVTLANAAGEDIVLHEDASASKRSIVTVDGLVGIGNLRESKRVRPSAHGSLNETSFEEGRAVHIAGEVMSQVSIEQALEEFRKITAPALQTLDHGPALLKWTEGITGLKLQMSVRLDSDLRPILQEGAGFVQYTASFFAEDPRAYSQAQTTAAGASITGTGPEPEWLGIGGTEGSADVAIDSTHVYWATHEGIGRAAIGGTSVEAGWIKGVAAPTGIAVDASHIYWSHGFEIGRATIAGATIEQGWIKPGSTGSIGAIAVNAEHIYWHGTHAGPPNARAVIGRAAIAGTSVESEWIPGAGTITGPRAVAVDSGHVYWATPEGIGRATLAGAEANGAWIAGAARPSGIAVSATFIYWSNETGSTIGRAEISGGNVNQAFLVGVNTPSGLAANTEHVYWSENFAGFLGRGPIAGSPIGSNVTVSQTGNRPSPLTFKIFGPCVNPAIVRKSDGATIGFLGTVASGNYLEVNVAARTVKLNGITSELGLLNAQAMEWLAGEAPISPNSETYQLAASSATAAKLEVLYRSAYA